MAVSVTPTGDIPLRHGYTLASIHELTLIAVHCELFYRARDCHERVDIAWSAIAEHLYASEQPPSRSDLIHAGMSAIASLFVSEARSHGINVSQRGRTAVPGTNFQKYWHLSARPTDGPEERIVECIALTQIWAALSPRLRDAFTPLAVHNDYGRAAAAVGKTRDQYNSQLSYARRVFLALWHEHETPSRPWGHDRRSRTHITPRDTARIMRQRRRTADRGTACAGQSLSFAEDEQGTAVSNGLPETETANAPTA